VPDPGPPTRVVVRNAKLRIYSETAPGLDVQVTGLQAELPVAGPAANGWVELGEVKLGDQNLVEGLRVGLEWQKPVLILPTTEFDCWGLPLRVQAQVLSGRRMLTSVQVGMPQSALESMEVSGFPGARASAAQVEMVGSFQGDALRPATWQGNLVAAGQGLVVENAGKPLALFEYGRVAVDFRNGVLHVPDGRLISESFSLLGNGAVNWDGRILGVLRVVTDPSGNEALTRGAIGTHLSRWTSSWLEPLETPDRLYRDVHLEGPIGQARMDLGRSEDGIVVWQAWEQVASFLRGEQLEEAMGVPHSPERDGLLLQK
jgi:hypothetical protein